MNPVKAIYMYKLMKNSVFCIKSKMEVIPLRFTTNDRNDKGFLHHKKCRPKGIICPLLVANIYKIIANLFKIRDESDPFQI